MKNWLSKSIGFSLAICLGFACNKLTTGIQRSPIDFAGIIGIEASTGGAYVINWGVPSGAELESFSIYYQQIDSDHAVALTPSMSDSSKGLAVTPTAEETPSTSGQLLSIVDPSQTNFKTPGLDEGYYLFQVKALTKDGRTDANTSIYLLKVNPADSFKGVVAANVVGANVVIEWLPAPGVNSGDNIHYTVYKGPAFNTAIAYTKENSMVYSLANEIDGDVVYFGVRFTDVQNREEQNTALVAVTIPQFNKDYLGCINAVAQSADRVKVNFEWPSAAKFTELKILRNSREIFSTSNRGIVSFIDRGLSEGEVYTYSCIAFGGDDSISGINVVRAGTLTSNPPTFAGIKAAAAVDGNNALLSWGVSTGVPATDFKIYSNPGTVINWGGDAISSVAVSNLSNKLAGLGDDLNYSFGVRACTSAICDSNTEQITVLMPDAGPPKTIGAESATIEQGKLKITAPWSPNDGGVSKRHIFVRIEPAADFTLTQTVLVTDPLSVPIDLYLENIVAEKIYHVMVRDEDIHGQRSTNQKVLTVTTGDLSPPAFNGITSLEVGAAGKEETSLKVNFAAVAPLAVLVPKGAKNYRFYAREGGGNACSETYFKISVPGSTFAVGPASYILEGLKAKTNYSVCVKIIDQYENLSANTNFLARSTLDTTKPEFDGIQSLVFDAVKGEVRITWNPSTASDIYEYKIETWLTPKGLSSDINTSISRRATDSPDSFNLTKQIIPYQSEDQLEVAVHACDNAGAINGGSQNCTIFARIKALKIIFEDILPPPDFLGIAALSEQATPEQGKIIVKWIAPPVWDDYAGFKIYTVGANDALTVIKDCPCTLAHCADHRTTCELSDLDPYRSYRLHVRAYDTHANYTILDPASTSVTVRVTDTVAPVFTSNLGLTFVTGAATLDWVAASDNQYAAEPGAVINYKVYRKVDSNFTNLLDPSIGGTLIATQPQLGYSDIGKFVSGKTYYYSVCAEDASGRRTCDGNFKSITIPDLTPPVISSFTSSKTTTGKTWNLNWAASDNITLTGELFYRIKYRASTDPAAVLNDTDTTVFTQTGTTTYTGLIGPQNTDTYIHYLLIVSDSAGNTAKKQITVYSQNKIEITSVKSSEGPTTGGKLLYIVGKGFHSSSTVNIGTTGTTACGSLQIISDQHILCRAPAKTAGTYSVTIANSDGSSVQTPNAYTACVPNSTCQQICNNSNSWEATFAIATNRGTAEATPLVVCTGEHLWRLTTKGFGFYYVLGDNIDLSNYTSNSWTGIYSSGQATNFGGYVDGGGYAVTNLSYNNAANTQPMGLFRKLQNQSKIKNLAVLNVNITSGNYVGGLTGWTEVDDNIVVEDVVVQGNISGTNYVGGVSGEFRGSLYRAQAFGTVTGISSVGGVVGKKARATTDFRFEGTVYGLDNSNTKNIGGLIGEFEGNGGTAANMIFRGTVRNYSTVNWHTGGLFGYVSNAIVKNSIFAGTLLSDSSEVGGIGGYSTSVTYENVNVSGTVTGKSRTGGLSGWTKNLKVINSENSANVTGTNQSGGLVAYTEGGSTTEKTVISAGSRNLGSVTATQDSGGLVGYSLWVEILNSYNLGNVSGQGSVGGLVGWANNGGPTKIDQSYNAGNVTGTTDSVGGVIGGTDPTYEHFITKSFNSGTVKAVSQVGGVAGTFAGQMSNSYSTGDVTGTGNDVGGAIGWLRGGGSSRTTLIEDNYATGAVHGGTLTTGDNTAGFAANVEARVTARRNFASGKATGFNRVAGFFGSAYSTGILIEKNFALGSVYGIGSYAGGFAGVICQNISTASECVVKNNYSRGDVEANNRAGGFSGWIKGTVSGNFATGKVQKIDSEAQFGGFNGELQTPNSTANNFWDKTSSERATSTVGTGKTTIEMKDAATFSAFDTTAWSIAGGRYPKLLWEITP